ncbi:MAG TPA: aspartate aminotransferase family protein [Terriglobales bacterium]|nr:aspartate aminotransferase family protein [Terriglobales bacterium]
MSSLATIAKAEAELLVPTYERHRVLFREGRGCYLYDDEGRRYLDFLSGIGVNALGYNHPAVRKVLREQSAKLIHISNLFYHDYQAQLARKLTKISGLDRAFFCNSGTEAIEGALKLARAYARTTNSNGSKPRWRVLAMDNSFHGRTFGALAATSTLKYRAPFGPLMPGVRFVRSGDVADLERKFDSSVCAILLEPVQGEGGIYPLGREFLQRARELSAKSGAVLIADEIQCGLGRTGSWFAYQHFGIKPDIVTVAKPLAAGLPLGAILSSSAVAGSIHPGLHGTTFGGGPLACAVALAVLDTIERDNLLKHAREVGAYAQQQLGKLKQRHSIIRDVRGLGVMLAIELTNGEAAKFAAAECLKRGVIINRTHEVVLRLLPPFIIEKRHVDALVSTLEDVLNAWESGHKQSISEGRKNGRT